MSGSVLILLAGTPAPSADVYIYVGSFELKPDNSRGRNTDLRVDMYRRK
jgi:hypothetical protein